MSENKKSLSKKNAFAVAGMALAALMVAAAFSSVVPPQTASAQEEREQREREVHREFYTRARALGVATDSDGNDLLSSMIQAIKQVEGEENKYETKAGFLWIRADDETRNRFAMIAETWEIVVSEDGLTFDATGKVKDSEGNEYNIDLDGYFARHVARGNIWSIEGTMEGNGIDYELHYVGLSRIGLLQVVEQDGYLDEFQ